MLGWSFGGSVAIVASTLLAQFKILKLGAVLLRLDFEGQSTAVGYRRRVESRHFPLQNTAVILLAPILVDMIFVPSLSANLSSRTRLSYSTYRCCVIPSLHIN